MKKLLHLQIVDVTTWTEIYWWLHAVLLQEDIGNGGPDIRWPWSNPWWFEFQLYSKVLYNAMLHLSTLSKALDQPGAGFCIPEQATDEMTFLRNSLYPLGFPSKLRSLKGSFVSMLLKILLPHTVAIVKQKPLVDHDRSKPWAQWSASCGPKEQELVAPLPCQNQRCGRCTHKMCHCCFLLSTASIRSTCLLRQG